ncbi:MAG: hypothetical protein Q8R24_06155 [Legionellaceae bacterium]|nr:hypothetical protein [Legionellaceae bacterium]
MGSISLGAVMGWFLVVMSLHLLFKVDHMRAVMADINMHPGLFFIFSVITLVFGLILVTGHNIWVMGWPVIVTLLGWFILFNSLVRLLFPDTAMRLGRAFFTHPGKMRILGVVLLIFGMLLLYHAYSSW